MKRLAPAFVIPAILVCMTGSSLAQDKPNIVLVFMDNFGWGEPGFNGGGIIRGAATPRLDKLASEGLCLKNFNVSWSSLWLMELSWRRVGPAVPNPS